MDWYYHDPGQGRVGPLSAEELRNRYRDRRIQADTLVWRDGMREWQPLERLGEELDLLSVKPDASRPPPLPPGAPVAMSPAYASPAYRAAPAAPAGHARAAPPPKRGMSGCLIALIVAGVLAVPVIGILAAIALPAYQEYTIRAKVSAAADLRAATLAPRIEAAQARLGRCPDDADEAGIEAADGVDFGEVDDRCAFRITLQGVHPKVDGKTVVFAAPAAASQPWDCSGGDLPDRYRRPQCRSGDE